MHCQAMYEQIHKFLQKRNWAPVSNDGEVSGIAWVELFVLFDIAGERTELGQYLKNPAASKRAAKRKLRSRCTKNRKSNLNNTIVVTKATLDEEIKEFVSTTILLWRNTLELLLHKVIEENDTTIAVDIASLADLLVVIFEGSYVVSKAVNEAELTAKQLIHLKNYFKLLFDSNK